MLRVPSRTKIAAPEPGGAPVVSDKGGGGSSGDQLKVPRSQKDGSWLLKGFSRKALAAFSNLPLAIAEMFAVAALMALGTVIEQGSSLMACTYTTQFPIVKGSEKTTWIACLTKYSK